MLHVLGVYIYKVFSVRVRHYRLCVRVQGATSSTCVQGLLYRQCP